MREYMDLMDRTTLDMLLYSQLKDQLNLLVITERHQDGGLHHSAINNDLYRSWLQAKRRKVLN